MLMTRLTNARGRHALMLALAALLAVGGTARADDEADLFAAIARAEALQKQAKYDEAAQQYQRALALAPRVFGNKLAPTVPILNGLAAQYVNQGKYARAEPLLRRALAIAEPALGRDHILVGDVLENLAATSQGQGKNAEAEPLYRRALVIVEKEYGPNHARVATLLGSLARLYSDQGKYAQAEPLYHRALGIAEKTPGADLVTVVTLLNSLAHLYKAQGKYARAEPLLRRALAVIEPALGRDHVQVIVPLGNLADLSMMQGKYAEAESLYRRALAVAEKAHGPDHSLVATALSGTAALYQEQAKFAAAEPLYRRALEVYEKALGPSHPDVTYTLNKLATLYQEQAKYDQAEPLLRRALAIREAALGPDHPDVAITLSNFAKLNLGRGEYVRAEPQLRRALAIFEKAHGQVHPNVAGVVNSLALVYHSQGKDAEAEPLLRRAVAALEAAYGPGHPALAQGLINLAVLSRRGNVAEAESLYRRALAIQEKALGPDHPDVALGLNNLAVLRCAQSEWADAGDLLDRQRRGVRRFVARELPALQQADQLTFLRATDEGRLHTALDVGLARPGDSALAARSAGWLLNGKAVAHQALAEQALLERDAADPARRDLVRQLHDVRRRHAALALSAAPRGDTARHREQLHALDGQRRDLERKLAAAGGTAAPAADPWVELAEVRRRLPANGTLVELAHFRAGDHAKGEFLAPRYAAWVIPPAGQGDVKVIDLGPAEAVDAAVAAVRRAIDDARGGGDRSNPADFKSATRPKSIAALGEPDAERLTRQALDTLAKLVLHPLLPVIGDKSHWLISPDASLWLAPWAALPLPDGKYAVEAHAITLLVSGRDLAAPPAAPRADAPQPVVLADPDFDLSAADAAARMKRVLPHYAAPADGPRDARLASRLPKVGALPGTAAEARAVKPALEKYSGREPWLYLEGHALEAVAKSLRGNRVVVFSTHGFALPDQEVEPDGKADFAGGAKAPAKAKGGGALENPLVRCGLLLAGCNRRGEGTPEDGVLTGLEIVGTDLRGTELVVLSACETGLGDVRNGEGVAGLRQAFQLAGARAVVATQWQVPDRESAQLMTAFFDHLAAGKSKADALRAAQLQMIEGRRAKGAAAHPYFWAAYTLTGQ